MVIDTTDNDDFLILDDDDDYTDTPVIEENTGSLSNEIIDFDEEITSPDKKVDIFGESKENENNLNLLESSEEDNLNLLEFTEEATEKNEVIKKPVSIVTDLKPKINSVGTMKDILDRAMFELDSRSKTISKDKDLEEHNIADLRKQVKGLESLINLANKKVSDLTAEQIMIAKNRESIEVMKKANINNAIKSKTVAAKVNTKRKQAA